MESIGSLGNAKTACGASHQIKRIVRALNGQIVRIEGTITIDTEEVPAAWVKTGRLISLRGQSITHMADETDYSLCLIENISES